MKALRDFTEFVMYAAITVGVVVSVLMLNYPDPKTPTAPTVVHECRFDLEAFGVRTQATIGGTFFPLDDGGTPSCEYSAGAWRVDAGGDVDGPEIL